ncbi:MAG: MBL fold metallo-hydrolase [Micrococcales bacterium]|nr:MBL fold metallo-hydrolase [Micrococcales bacterium]
MADDEVEQLGTIQLRRTVVGPLATNVYLLTDPTARRQVLIDPGDEPDTVLALVGSGLPRATLDTVVVTHRHLDHIEALAGVVEVTRARVATGYDDADAVTSTTGVHVHRALRHGDKVLIGSVEAEVIALRGHTPGSIALAVPEHRDGKVRWHLFVGDALFPGGLGKTATPDLFAQLYTDLVVRVFDRYDDETTVRPGHGLMTTLGDERPHLRKWRERGW